jgi:hypothetical protein
MKMKMSRLTGDWSINFVVTGPEMFFCHKLIENICLANPYKHQMSVLKTAYTSTTDWSALLAFFLARHRDHALRMESAPCVLLVGTPSDLLQMHCVQPAPVPH